MSRNNKESLPTRPSIKTLWIGDHQIEEFFVPYKERMEGQMEGEIEFIANPQEALGILEKKAENGSLPDILVIKSYMLGVSGLWLIKAIKDHQNSRLNSLPICVLAGYLEESEKAKLEEWKIRTFNLALIKENLHQIRLAWEENQEKEPSPQLIKVLWVDDQDYLIRTYIEMIKTDIGGEIELVSSAQEALGILEERAEKGTLPDIIISDFTMPKMNGLQFAEAIRNHEDERIKSLPFCIASSHIIWKDQDKLKELGIPTLDKEDAILRSQKIRQIWEESKRRA